MSAKAVSPLASESFWQDKRKFDEAERVYREKIARGENPVVGSASGGEQGKKGKPSEDKAKSDNKQKMSKSEAKKEKQKALKQKDEHQSHDQVKHHENHSNKNKKHASSSSSSSTSCSKDIPADSVSLSHDIARVREHIKLSLDSAPTGNSGSDPLINRLTKIEQENRQLKSSVTELEQLIKKLELRVSQLEGKTPTRSESNKKVSFSETKKAEKPADDDDDVDLFGSDDEDNAEAEELKKKRVEEYAAKKAKKPGVIAKSSVILDVKPWDDETDMAELEKHVRSVEMDGLLWGVSKLVPLAYGIKKLQIVMVIEDDKVSVEELTEKLEEFEDFVQSVDVAAFNKI